MIDPMKPMVLPKTGAGTANPSPVLRTTPSRAAIGATSKRLTTESPEDIAAEEAYMNRGRRGIGRLLRNRYSMPPLPEAPKPPKPATTPDTTPKARTIEQPDSLPTKPTPMAALEGLAENRYIRSVAGVPIVRGIGQQVWAMGAVNPFPEFAGTKGMKIKSRFIKGAGPGLMRILAPFLALEAVRAGSGAASTATSGEWGSTDQERLDYLTRTISEDYGYPEDIARELATSLDGNIMSRLATVVGSAGDQAINDAIALTLFTIVGGAIGGVAGFFGAGGVGALPMAGIGASRGYAIGRGVVGTSNLLNLAEMALTLQSGQMADLPTIDDFSPWTNFNKSQPFFDANNNGIQDAGEQTNPNYNPDLESGKYALGTMAGGIFNNSLETGWKTIMEKYPDRFVDPAVAAEEESRYARGFYILPGNNDPRIGETVSLISQGYFVYKNSNNEWAIDLDGINTYLKYTTRYKQMDDKMKVLDWLYDGQMKPNTEFVGTLKDGITQEIYNDLWYNDID